MLLTVYVLWGSTAPAIRIAVATIPPYAMAAIRFGIAGGALWGWSRLRRVPLPARAEWRGAAGSGVLMLVLSNGVFSWVLQYIPSGVGALFFALSPLWMAILGWVLYRERLAAGAAVGIALGLGGMAYLFSPGGGQHLPTLPLALGIFTSLAWALGSMLQRTLRGVDVVQTSAMQMLAASATLAVAAAATGERLHAAQFTPAALGALGYLVVFGSVVGFSAFLWLMRNVPTTLASTYSYVNPVVSLAIGIGFLHEPFGWRLAAGAGVIVLGVAAMALSPKPVRS